MVLTLAHAIVFTGASNAIVLTTALLKGVRDTRNLWAALFFLCLAVGVLAVIVAHQIDGRADAAAWGVASALFLLGPLYHGHCRASGSSWPWRIQVRHLTVGAGAALLAAAVDGRSIVLVAQLGAYLLASWPFLRAQAGERKLTVAMAIVMLVIIGGEVARIASPSGVPCDLSVMLVAAASAVALFLVLRIEPARASYGARYRKSGVAEPALRLTWERLMDALMTAHLYRQSTLRLEDLARAAGVPHREASQALSQVGKTSFHEVLSNARVQDAMKRLIAHENRHVSVEPIGMEAGFRSRSAFYAAFHRATGLSPAGYRSRHIAGNVSGPVGKDVSG